MELRACLREHSQRGVRLKRKEKGDDARTLSVWALSSSYSGIYQYSLTFLHLPSWHQF